MSESPSGTSRRDLLRGSAIGMGALVGAMALMNATEQPAEALTSGTSLKFLGGFSGINLSAKQPVQTIAFGGSDVNGIPAADQVVLTMDTNRYSPKVLDAFSAGTKGLKVVVDGYHADRAGKETKFLTITLTGAEIVGYHFASSTGGTIQDTIRLSFGVLVMDNLEVGKQSSWQPVA